MSEFIVNEPSSGGFIAGFINDVTFLYVSIQAARDKFSKDGKEYSAKLVVDKKTAKAFKKVFPKNGFQEVDTENFEEQFGVEPPDPDAESQFIIVLKARDDKYIKVEEEGEEVEKIVKLNYSEFKRPKVYVPSTEGVKDITMELEIGNGSRGDASFWVQETQDFGSFPKLSGILVNDLIIYESQSKNKCAFGNVVNAASSQDHFASQEKEIPPGPENVEIPY